VAVLAPELLKRLGRKRSRTADKQPHLTPNCSRRFVVPIVHSNVHRRHSEEERCLEIEELLRGVFMVEPFEQPQPASRQQPRMQPIAEPVDMEQRQCQ